MKPRLGPGESYKFRIIICDDQGNQVNDDVARLDQIIPLTETLIKDLKKKREGI